MEDETQEKAENTGIVQFIALYKVDEKSDWQCAKKLYDSEGEAVDHIGSQISAARIKCLQVSQAELE